MKAIIIGDHIVFNTTFVDNYKAKACGARFQPSTKKWRAKATKLTASAVRSNFREDEIDPAILALLGPDAVVPPLGCAPAAMVRVVTPTARQAEGVEKAWPHQGYAFFWVMGAGKTLSTIILANLRRAHSLIDQVLVICPTSIKGVWSKEYERYSAMEQHVHILESGGKDPKYDGFPIMVVGVEALSQGGAFQKAMDFVIAGRTMVVIDESSTIKNHDAGRTERCWEIGQNAQFRLILTGTNVTQGVQDLFAQMYFVDPCIVGELSYYSFRNKYCVLGGFEQRKIVGYKDIDLLFNKIRPFCDVIRKKDMKGLPDKNYQIREVKASPDQIRACKELAREMKTRLGDKTVTVQNALEALLRFQQIAGGFDPDGTPLTSNPKMAELMNVLEECNDKAIIWARFLPEVAAITTALEKRWPGSTLSLCGSVDSSLRQPMVDEFQINASKRFFVVNQATGAKGLTLTAATLSVYYSNTFSHEDRSQSEDRNHRIGQEFPVTYVDLITNLKVDKLIHAALATKKDVSNFVNDSLHIDDLL